MHLNKFSSACSVINCLVINYIGEYIRVFLDLSLIAVVLSAVCSVAVVAGLAFVVFQLRENARLTNATMQGNRLNVAFSILSRIIDDSFVRRRKNVYDTVQKYSPKNWADFIGTLEDFEARNYAYMFEMMGQLVRDDLIDGRTVMNTLKYIVVTDWKLLEPMIRFLNDAYKVRVNPWGNFEWLAKETEKYLISLEAGGPSGSNH